MKYKQFDWEEANRICSPLRINYYKQYWDKPVTEKEYIVAMKIVKPYSKYANTPIRVNRERLNANYTPSKLRKEYRRLKNVFGFFGGLKELLK